MPSATKNAHGDSHFPQRLKNFFRISSGSRDREASNTTATTTTAQAGHGTPRSDSKTAFRQTRFFSVGRLRSATTASEGNPLEESLSPTAHANPYFAHQGQPGLRHHDGSVPPSPPDTPMLKVEGPNGGAPENITAKTKEELARKLRRVASAPNAQGLFAKGADGERPATAELGKEPLAEGKDPNAVGFAAGHKSNGSSDGLAPPDSDGLGALPPPNQSTLAFRRTYSSNSIKVRNVEVGPQSFDKIKLIGKGDVGKVYLVREKKSSRLYAMKGQYLQANCHVESLLICHSAEQEGDDQAEQDQEGSGGTGNSGHQQPPFYRNAVSLFPVRGLPLPLHGILQRW